MLLEPKFFLVLVALLRGQDVQDVNKCLKAKHLR
jgi:hypothetical protein